MPADEKDPWEDFLHLPGGNLFYQGYCQFYSGEDDVSVDLAVHYFERAVDKAREAKGHYYPFYYYRALGYEARKDYTKAKDAFKEILEMFKPGELKFKEIVKYYQALQPTLAEIKTEIERLEKLMRGVPVHMLFIDRYLSLRDELKRQETIKEKSKDEVRLQRRASEKYEEVLGAEIKAGRDITVEVVGENLDENVLGDLNSQFWMHFQFFGEEVPGFGFYWTEKDGKGTVLGSAQIDKNNEVFAAILRTLVTMSENMPDLKFYVETSDVPDSVFSSELELKAGKWVIYRRKIAEFLESTPVGM
jgi:tetratricopeptide (TPR) repeat protein